MGAVLQFVGDWGHALAAVLFAALGIFLLRRRDETPEPRLIAAALLMTSCWALYISFGGVSKSLSGIVENVRNAAWLLALFVMLRRGPAGRAGSMGGIAAVYAAVAGLLLVQTIIDLCWLQLPPHLELQAALVTCSVILHMMTAIGGLLLVHHLYAAWPSRERGGASLLLGALAAMWTYDLILYAFVHLAPERVGALYALRGLMAALMVPVIAIGLRRGMSGRLQLSRSIAFQSLSAAAAGLYVLVLLALAVLIELVAGPYARAIEIGAVFFTAVTALVLLPTPALRAFWKVQVAKHFFQHRYDYRTEWMRFIDTIGRPGQDAAPLGERVARAVADITDSPAALLLLRDDKGALALETHWNWTDASSGVEPVSADAAGQIERHAGIIDIALVRNESDARDLPAWLLADPRAWALVPLIHYDRLIGAVLLATPAVDRRLDWEDFDMLRAAGRQAATYISESLGQQALGDAQRFDEFNRRFAFIAHDIKNLVSQLSLLSRNAERHADNPDFRADMVLTLRESVDRMNDMLARLSQHNKARPEEPRPLGLRPLLDRLVHIRARQHPLRVSGDAPPAMADPARVEQIVTHLLQNAIEASKPDSMVELRLSTDATHVLLDIVDHGCGMSADYVRRELFKPFSSSKAGGFGLGAFEARSLAQALGGSLTVESQPGAGSRFTLRLPLAPQQTRQEKAA